MLDLVNPVGAGRGLVGGGWQARLYEGGSTQHAAYLGGRPEESNQTPAVTQREPVGAFHNSSEVPLRVRERERATPSAPELEGHRKEEPPAGGSILCRGSLFEQRTLGGPLALEDQYVGPGAVPQKP